MSIGPAPPPYPGPDLQQQLNWLQPLDSTEGRNGLEYLLPLDTVLLKRKKDFMSNLMGIPVPNSYSLTTLNDEQIFHLTENSNGYESRSACRPQRGFIVGAVNANGREVAVFNRKTKSSECIGCCACGESCMDDMTVESPPGHTVGRVKQVYNCSTSRFVIHDSNGEAVFRIDGISFCLCCVTGVKNMQFSLVAADGTGVEVASISKNFYANTVQQLMTPGADTIVIKMPRDMHLDMKIAIIGVAILFDFTFFDIPLGNGGSSNIQNREMIQLQTAMALQQGRQMQQMQTQMGFQQQPMQPYGQPMQGMGTPMNQQTQMGFQQQPMQPYGQPEPNQNTPAAVQQQQQQQQQQHQPNEQQEQK